MTFTDFVALAILLLLKLHELKLSYISGCVIDKVKSSSHIHIVPLISTNRWIYGPVWNFCQKYWSDADYQFWHVIKNMHFFTQKCKNFTKSV